MIIPIAKIQELIDYEGFVISTVLILLSYFFYVFFLKKISLRRHGQLRERFINTVVFLSLSGLVAGVHWVLFQQSGTDLIQSKISSYVALIALILGSVTVIKIGQIILYLYLFFSNISTGVPRLISNMFTIVFSLFIFGLIGTSVFNLNLTTVATTSAVFSLVLGLAMQDTLGNFFSGLALQIDRPFHINDWVEVQNGDQKLVGQIHEINWRATYIITFSDELLMFPNRMIAQSQITILSHNLRAVRLNQSFRFHYDAPIEKIKGILESAVKTFPAVMGDPGVTTLVTETTDSWITIKVFYSLHDYGTRYRTGDAIISKVMADLRREDIKLAHQTYSILSVQ